MVCRVGMECSKINKEFLTFKTVKNNVNYNLHLSIKQLFFRLFVRACDLYSKKCIVFDFLITHLFLYTITIKSLQFQ